MLHLYQNIGLIIIINHLLNAPMEAVEEDPVAALDEAIALAERIARNAPLAVAASKALIRATQGATEEELWAVQQPFLKSVWASQDAKEGPRAFAEKRAPEWTGACPEIWVLFGP